MSARSLPAIGDAISYRSIAEETWDAVILDIRKLSGRPTVVDIDIFLPGAEKPTHTLRGTLWLDDPKDPRPGARPRS